MKVAIVGNWFWRYRGAERVISVILEKYPDADIYFLFGYRDLAKKHLGGGRLFFSPLNKLPFIDRFYKYTFFLWPLIMRLWRFGKYDLVISLSASTVKGVRAGDDSKHLVYMLTPMRPLWDLKDLYQYRGFGGSFYEILRHILRLWDFYKQDADSYVAISDFVKRRCTKFYESGVYQQMKVIYPPVRFDRISYKEEKDDYLLLLSQFEENKEYRRIVRIAQENNIQLKVVGESKSESTNSVEYLDTVSEYEKAKLLRGAKAVVMLGIEDWGIVAAEAIASGTPVITRSDSGTSEIVDHLKTGYILEPRYSDSDFLKSIKYITGLNISVDDSNRIRNLYNPDRFHVEFGSVISQILKENG